MAIYVQFGCGCSTLWGLNEQVAAAQREDAVSFGLIALKLCQHWTCWLGMMRWSTLVLGCCVKISHGWCRYIGCRSSLFYSIPGKHRKVMLHYLNRVSLFDFLRACWLAVVFVRGYHQSLFLLLGAQVVPRPSPRVSCHAVPFSELLYPNISM